MQILRESLHQAQVVLLKAQELRESHIRSAQVANKATSYLRKVRPPEIPADANSPSSFCVWKNEIVNLFATQNCSDSEKLRHLRESVEKNKLATTKIQYSRTFSAAIEALDKEFFSREKII